MRLHYTAAASRDVIRLVEWYASRGLGAVGRRYGRRITAEARTLIEHPDIGPVEGSLEHLGLGHRYLLVGRLHKVIYRIEGEVVVITDVFDVRQDPSKMRG